MHNINVTNLTDEWKLTHPDALAGFVAWMSVLFIAGVVGNLLVLLYYPWKSGSSKVTTFNIIRCFTAILGSEGATLLLQDKIRGNI